MQLMAERRHVAETNLKLCFPDMPQQRREQLLKDVFSNTAMMLFESGIAWWGSDSRKKPMLEVRGEEHLRPYLERKQGVILLSGHFTPIEMVGSLLKFIHRFTIVRRRNKNPVFEHIAHTSRLKSYNIIDKSSPREIARALRNGEALWLSMDQDPGRKSHVFADFMGVNTATMTAATKLARLSKAVVVPMFYFREGSRYVVEFMPALDDFPGECEKKDAERINQLIADKARQHPDQYYWVHRRFRTRPEGEASIYPASPRQIKRQQKRAQR